VLTAERALLTELGFHFPDFPLHGEVYRSCVELNFSVELMQAAWNVANDRCFIFPRQDTRRDMLHDKLLLCSFLTRVGTHWGCDTVTWAVLLTAVRFFGEECLLRDKSGEFVWLRDGVKTSVVEGARSQATLFDLDVSRQPTMSACGNSCTFSRRFTYRAAEQEARYWGASVSECLHMQM
jgi:hypothetical protein